MILCKYDPRYIFLKKKTRDVKYILVSCKSEKSSKLAYVGIIGGII